MALIDPADGKATLPNCRKDGCRRLAIRACVGEFLVSFQHHKTVSCADASTFR